MEKLVKEDFKTLDFCPWCGKNIKNVKVLYIDFMNCPVLRCTNCGIVFSRRRLNSTGLKKYWNDYFSRVHNNDKLMVEKREKMYKIDFDFIHQYVKSGKLLDVGCGNGDFLKLFESNGYEGYGVEFGKEAAEIAAKKHNIYYGDFPNMEITDRYNLIVFRGVLQYVPDAVAYLNKAINLLNDNGYIFITAQPNMDSFCFKLFLENFTQPVTGSDFIGYTENIFTTFFIKHEMRKIAEKYFYEETPYANIEDDILKVANAIQLRREKKQITFKAPPFYGNMLSLIYKN